MTHSSSLLSRAFSIVLLLTFFSAASQVRVFNTGSDGCTSSGGELIQLGGLPALNGEESEDCCQTEKNQPCCDASHLLVGQVQRGIQLSLLRLSDEDVHMITIRLSSLNPPPLIRPPVIT